MITLKMAWWLGLASVVMFVGSLLAMPVLLGQIPADYFLPERMADADRKHPLLRWMLFGLKNLLGTVLLLAGMVMLFTPGQGVLTILVGLFLLDFPGKRRLELWLIRRPRVLESINWLRARRCRVPLELPSANERSAECESRSDSPT